MRRVTATPEHEPVRALPTVRIVNLDDIREAPGNPRVIPAQAVHFVAESLRRFGWKQPLVTDRDGYLVVGHTRYRAARSLGLTQGPAIVAEDLTASEVDAYRIADNRTHDFSSWDLTALAGQLDDLYGDFGDVLALADWEAVTAELDAVTKQTLLDLDLSSEVQDALDGGFTITVRFHSKQEALAAGPAIMELPGAFDVRHNR